MFNWLHKMTNNLQYTELLDLEWAISLNTIKAQAKYDHMYQEYGKKDKYDLLTRLAYDDLKLLREAKKTLEKTIKLLREHNLYKNSV